MHEFELVQDLAIVLVFAGGAAWICQRLGVSVIVGYLLAGILIGPFTPPAAFVSSLESVHRLANLGLIFVMFFVGLELSVPRLRALGLPALAVTIATALLVLTSARFTAGAIGLGVTGGLFLGGILVVSSSAIIDKVFNELDISREPHAQLALGITVLEDIVAVVMLAILGSLAATRIEQATPLWQSLGKMAAFVVVVLLVALLAIPRLLRALRRSASGDVLIVSMAGVLLAVAWVAASAGYSIALGAFLLGSSLGGTQHKQHLEHVFAPVRDIFAAVFFVSMGMLFDVRLVVTEWPWVLALAAFAIVVRGSAAFGGLVLVGQPVGTAGQVALSLLPLGEFSFVIAQLGVSSGLMPPAFYPATVGAALITTLASPPLMRRGQTVARWLSARDPWPLRVWRSALDDAARALRRHRNRQPLLEMVSSYGLRLGFETAVVVSGIACSSLIFDALDEATRDHALHPWLAPIYWTALGLVLLVPLLAIWRGLRALGMILAEAVTESGGMRPRMRPVIERGVQVTGSIVVLLLCATFLPGWATRPWVLATIVGAGIALALIMRPLLVRWYTQVRIELRDNLVLAQDQPTPPPATRVRTVRAIAGAPSGLRLHEHVLSDLSPAAGRTLGETDLRRRFGCTLAGIERQGIPISAPGATVRLFPNDLLLLVGTPEQIDQAEKWLTSEAPARPLDGREELVTDQLRVPENGPFTGKTIRALAIASRFGVQILGVGREGQEVETCSPEAVLAPGDSLFVLGTDRQNKIFREWLTSGSTG